MGLGLLRQGSQSDGRRHLPFLEWCLKLALLGPRCFVTGVGKWHIYFATAGAYFPTGTLTILFLASEVELQLELDKLASVSKPKSMRHFPREARDGEQRENAGRVQLSRHGKSLRNAKLQALHSSASAWQLKHQTGSAGQPMADHEFTELPRYVFRVFSFGYVNL